MTQALEEHLGQAYPSVCKQVIYYSIKLFYNKK